MNNLPPVAGEAILEAARRYFGRRSDLEHSIDFLHKEADLLRTKAEDIKGLAAAVWELAPEFYQLIGLHHDIRPKAEAYTLAWTMKGKHREIVTDLYGQLYRSIGEYNDGEDVSCSMVKAYVHIINEKIDLCNSDSIEYCLSLSRGITGRESMQIPEGERTLDRDLEFKKVDLTSLGLIEIPGIPETIPIDLDRQYRTRKHDIQGLIKENLHKNIYTRA
jgi:hypothetical protein